MSEKYGFKPINHVDPPKFQYGSDKPTILCRDAKFEPARCAGFPRCSDWRRVSTPSVFVSEFV